MSVVARFQPTNLTTEKYDESVRRLKEAGEFPPDGWSATSFSGRKGTCASARSGTLGEQMQAFGERLMPILADIGIEFSGEPEIFDVHNTIKR